AQHQRAPALEAETGLLQGKQQPTIPPPHLLQDTALLCGQGVSREPFDPRLAIWATHMDLVGSLHRGLYPRSMPPVTGSYRMRGSGVTEDVDDVKRGYRKDTKNEDDSTTATIPKPWHLKKRDAFSDTTPCYARTSCSSRSADRRSARRSSRASTTP